ncbi:MAG: hypothetical protein ABI670_07155 [Chloroflexota bacterium]
MNANMQAIKADLARCTRRGINNLLTWLLLWTGFALLALTGASVAQRALVYILGALLFWPLALAIGRLLGVNLFARGNPLFLLYLLLSGLQILLLPLLVGTSFVGPEMVTWYLGITMGVQLLLFAWLYDSSAYLFSALGTMEVAALIGWLTPGIAYVAMPIAVLPVLAISTSFLLRENATATKASTTPSVRS